MCTNFKHRQAADGSVAVGRTMEFPDVLPWQLSVLASDFAGSSGAVQGGRSWTGTYGVVGVGAFEPQWLADGTNTAGLSAHLLYMPGHCTFAQPRNDGTDIGVIEALAFLLGTCATVAEAKTAAATCNVVDFTPPQIPVPLPTHIILHDSTSCAVVEFHPDGMVISDNPVQVATNAPYLDWHLTNVSNHLSLSTHEPADVTIGGRTFTPLGQGSGFAGLPGDGSAPSRFIRVLADVRFAQQPADERALLTDCVRILHTYDIVPGTIEEDVDPKTVMPEMTMWSTVSNLTGHQYVVNTEGDPLWYSIDLTSTDFTSSRLVAFPSDGAFSSLTV
ncbi:MAG: linear amide C-N hydrolase [Ilumatobacteraceae bacterium]